MHCPCAYNTTKRMYTSLRGGAALLPVGLDIFSGLGFTLPSTTHLGVPACHAWHVHSSHVVQHHATMVEAYASDLRRVPSSSRADRSRATHSLRPHLACMYCRNERLPSVLSVFLLCYRAGYFGALVSSRGRRHRTRVRSIENTSCLGAY